jgi:hypothetical protein
MAKDKLLEMSGFVVERVLERRFVVVVVAQKKNEFQFIAATAV